MGDLYLTLLGPPEARHANQVLLFSTRKELALLIYLAVEGGIYERKKLSELFWPEGDAKHGRAALRISLLHLRHLLCEDTSVEPVSHFLIKRDTLGLDLTSNLKLDLHTLQEAWAAAHASTHTTLTMPEEERRTLLARLQHAISLPRGEFLEGFALRDAPAFDDWVRFQREYWHLRTGEVFDRLSQMQFEAGELEAAIETVNRWLVFAPLHEDAYRRLMRLHFAAGDRVAALHAYDNCRAILATGMQTEPTLETVALASRMRAVAPPRRKESPTPALALSPAAFLEGPLLGRTTELSTLIKAYHTARRGQTQVVLLEGEVGIGKTRLASEFLAWAEVEGADVLRGQAFETGGQLPYLPVIEALRPRIERENAPDDLLSDLWLAELSRLLPELRDRYPDLPDPGGDRSGARNRLFEAVARLGQSLAARAPLVLFIDDVQWADAASLDVVHYLARRLSESEAPALLLLTLRLEERAMRPALPEWRTGMERAVPLTHLPLGPLSAEDILSLLQAFSGKGGKDGGQSPDLERFGQWLFAETEGHPFYLMETLKVLLDRGALTSRPNENGGWTIDFTAAMQHEMVVRGFFPPSVREVICTRLDRLAPNAFALLVAGAVLGQGITFERLCQVADLTEQDGLSALDEVLHSHLLHESERQGGRGTAGRYVFAHAKIRAVVYGEAGEARRSIFHRRALEVLQAAAAPAAVLAYHALAAGLAEPAFRWSLAAGDEAMHLVAVRDAITFYEQAWHLLTGSVPSHGLEARLPAPEIEHLYTHLGRAYELNAEWEKARTAYTSLFAYARDACQPALESTALNRLSTLAAP
ncbi:MAG TPA: AAA family ATPase [Ktedonobacteraceae bacterium]|nr:AAA family ATPase [Ktedonobacteraceae bacterium]